MLEQVHVSEVKKVLAKNPRGQALSYLTAFEFKVEMAQFHLDSLPQVRGTIPARSHTEAAIFQMKAALDCAAEAVNQVYRLRIDPGYALSIEQLCGEKGKALASRNPPVRSWMGRLFGEQWWLDFKELRDKITHQGLAIHHITMNLGGSEPSSLAHLEVNGRISERELRDDLEEYLLHVGSCGEEMCRLLLRDPAWQQS